MRRPNYGRNGLLTNTDGVLGGVAPSFPPCVAPCKGHTSSASWQRGTTDAPLPDNTYAPFPLRVGQPLTWRGVEERRSCITTPHPPSPPPRVAWQLLLRSCSTQKASPIMRLHTHSLPACTAVPTPWQSPDDADRPGVPTGCGTPIQDCRPICVHPWWPPCTSNSGSGRGLIRRRGRCCRQRASEGAVRALNRHEVGGADTSGGHVSNNRLAPASLLALSPPLQ